MTETSYPFANAPGNTMTENQWAQMFRYILGTGVMSVGFQDQLNQLIVYPGSTPLTINIDTGAGWIQGHYYQSDSVNTLNITQNYEAGIRADLVVLECKWGLGAGITAKVIEGTSGAVWPTTNARSGTPMPPMPVQTYGVRWQLPIAQVNTTQNKSVVYIQSDIIDWRAFVNSGGAKSSTFVIASDAASPTIRANADAVIPYGSVNAEQTINEAISIVSGYGGGTVLLSEGTFNTSGSIESLSNVNIRGLGNKTLIQYNIGFGGTNNNPVINVDLRDNVQITDLSIDGGGVTLSDASPAAAVDGYDGIYINGGKMVTVRNCMIQRCKASGISMFSSDSTFLASYGNRIDGCYVGDNYAYGIYSESNGCLIQNNQLNHNLYGIYLYCATGTGSSGANMNIISNNEVRNSLYDGISIVSASGHGCTMNQISNNIVSNSSRAANITYSNFVLSGAYTKYNNITGNYSQSLTTPGPQYGIEMDTLNDYNFITGNYLYAWGIGGTTTTPLGPSYGAAHNRISLNFVATTAGAYDKAPA